MDKLKEMQTEELDKKERREESGSEKGGILASMRRGYARERRLVYDLLLFFGGLILGRCHVAFGVYPIGIALVSALPFGVWSALLGAALGALSVGSGGVIFAIAAAITAFLRIIISGGDGRGGVFGENLLLRMAASVIGGFIAAVYEILLIGINQTSALYAASAVLMPPVFTFVLSGLFMKGLTAERLLFGSVNMFSMEKRSDKEKYDVIFFYISALSASFLVSLSLSELDLFGISPAYVFIAFVTLIAAKRFGALRALTLGFVSTLGVSSVFAVSFALLGLMAGGLFGVGIGYGLIGGAIGCVGWGIYSSGLAGLLSVLPEYAIAAALSAPLLSKLSPEKTVRAADTAEVSARDMIGTMALTYQKGYKKNLDTLEGSLFSITRALRNNTESGLTLSIDEYEALILEAGAQYCSYCTESGFCKEETINPCEKNARELAERLRRGERLTGEDINTDTEFCKYSSDVAEAIMKRTARAEREAYRQAESSAAEEYELIGKLINEARLSDESECAVNTQRSDALSGVIEERGLSGGVGRVFGERRLRIILAAEDESGEEISSPELLDEVEAALSVRLSDVEYFRKGKMALMQCSSLPVYSTEYGTATLAGGEGSCSGDTLSLFNSESGCFYSLISDGMGRGEGARRASRFTADLLSRLLDFSASKETVLHLLNNALRRRGEECSATVDLFELDRYSGEATFIKSGAAPSYVKRGSSIFRLRSQTAPLGLLGSIDTEKIKVEIAEGDYVVMLSDGISQSAEESAWLLELLARDFSGTPKEYADEILSAARANVKGRDDMSVSVIRIVKA